MSITPPPLPPPKKKKKKETARGNGSFLGFRPFKISWVYFPPNAPVMSMYNFTHKVNFCDYRTRSNYSNILIAQTASLSNLFPS